MFVTKKPTEDYFTFGSSVNKEVERFNFNEMTIDQFKCLIFICGLQANDKDIRITLLSKIDSDPTLDLSKLLDECKKLVDLKSKSDLISPKSANSLVSQVQKVSKKSKFKANTGENSKSSTSSETRTSSETSKLPKRPCWLCGNMHWVKECTFSKHVCKNCNKVGHKEGFCNTGRPHQQHRNNFTNQTHKPSVKSNKVLSFSRTDFVSKRKYLLVEINDQTIKLQMDTASNITVISFDLYNELGIDHKRLNVSN